VFQYPLTQMAAIVWKRLRLTLPETWPSQWIWRLRDRRALPRLAVYTADSAGNLTTNSTSENMLTAEVDAVNDMATSPAGDLLAVAGEDGLQVFFFNGSKPITAYTGFLAVHNISQLF
jgi:hypothetical protein